MTEDEKIREGAAIVIGNAAERNKEKAREELDINPGNFIDESDDYRDESDSGYKVNDEEYRSENKEKNEEYRYEENGLESDNLKNIFASLGQKPKSNTEGSEYVQKKEKKPDIADIIRNNLGLIMLERINSGSYGIVYKCRDIDLNDIRAVKVIRKPREELHSKKKEADIQVKYKDYNAVTVHRAKIIEEPYDCLLIEMEYMDGSLNDLLRNSQIHISLSEVIRIGKAIGTTIEAMEDPEIPARSDYEKAIHHHWDIKPQNIMYKIVREDRVYKLGDFGCAFKEGGTLVGGPGTAKYCTRDGDPDDIYALGRVLVDVLEQKGYKESELASDLLQLFKNMCDDEHPENRGNAKDFLDKIKKWENTHKDELFLDGASADEIYIEAEKNCEGERRIRYYKAAADRNHAMAAFRLANIIESDQSACLNGKLDSMKYLQRAAELEHPEAMNILANRQIKEKGEVIPEAIDMIRKSAGKGCLAAKYNLSLLIRCGIVPQEEPDEAKHLLREAADGDYGPAVTLLNMKKEQQTVSDLN